MDKRKLAKEFTSEEIKGFVLKLFPSASDFYKNNNYYQFAIEDKVYFYYFCDSADTFIDIHLYIDDIKKHYLYICSITFYKAD